MYIYMYICIHVCIYIYYIYIYVYIYIYIFVDRHLSAPDFYQEPGKQGKVRSKTDVSFIFTGFHRFLFLCVFVVYRFEQV